MGYIESGAFQPSTPLFGQGVSINRHRFPFSATIGQIDVACVLSLLYLTAQLLNHIRMLLRFGCIIKVHGFPLSQLKRDGLFAMIVVVIMTFV
jgi:hypothetical protein